MDKNEYKDQKEKLIKKLKDSKQNMEQSIENLKSVKDKTDELLDITDRNLYGVNKSINLVDKFPNEIKESTTIELDQAFQSASIFGEILAKQSFIVYDKSKEIRGSFDIFASGTSVSSTSTDVTASTILTLASEVELFHPPLQNAIYEYNLPTILEKKDEIGKWLASIDNTINEKYQEAFDNFSSSRFMSACHSLRECLSHFLEKVSPDDELKQCSWYEKVPNTSRPTQKQRIKFAIIGKHDESFLSEEDIDVLESLMNEGRDIYTKLSSEAHSRKGDWEEKRTKNYIEITSNVLFTIKKLRNE